MNLSEISIKRPVLSTVFMLVIVLLGIIGYTYLGVREYPNIDNPIISVSVSYPGANAEVITNQNASRWSRVSTASRAYAR